MAETTSVYGLIKPVKSDYYDVNVFNENADIIDEILDDIQNNGGVGTSGLASSSVTTAKIASGAVTTAKIGSLAVTSTKIASNAVTESKIADGAVTKAKLSEALQEELDTYLTAEFVDELPTSTLENAFDTTVGFVAANRCTAEIVDSYLQITTASNAANTYAYAYYNLSSVLTDSTTSAVFEFDALISTGSRIKISLVDLSARTDDEGTISPGDSYRGTYDSTGVAFRFGEYSDGYALVQGDTKGCTFGDWMHFRYLVDVEERTVAYTITDRDTGTVLFSGTKEFLNDDAETVSGIEMYARVSDNTVDFDNLEVTANYDVDGSTLYAIENETDEYSLYIYKDGEPVKVASMVIDADSYLSITSTKPVQNKVISEAIGDIQDDVSELQSNMDSVNTSLEDKVDSSVFNVNGYAGIEEITADILQNVRSISGDGSSDTITYTTVDGTERTFKTKDTTYSEATSSAAGLMSASDKAKLDGLTATGLEQYSTTAVQVGEWIDGSAVMRVAGVTTIPSEGLSDQNDDVDISAVNSLNTKAILRQDYYCDSLHFGSYSEFYNACNNLGTMTVYYIIEYLEKYEADNGYDN